MLLAVRKIDSLAQFSSAISTLNDGRVGILGWRTNPEPHIHTSELEATSGFEPLTLCLQPGCRLDEAAQGTCQSHLTGRPTPGLEEFGAADEDHEPLSPGGSDI